MPGVEYPNIPAIRHEAIGFRVNMEGRAADLMQKPLPSSFAEGYARVANAAGKGQMAMGKAIESGSAELGNSLVAVGAIFGRLGREAEQSRDRMDYFRVKENADTMVKSFEAEAANKRWTPAEQAEYWPAWGQRLREMNAGLGATPTSKDLYQAQTESYIDGNMYRLMTEGAKESLRQDQALQESVFKKAIDDGDTITAAEVNETAHSLRKIDDATYENRKFIVEKTDRGKAEVEALNLNPWRLKEQTDSVMKGEKSEDFPYLKDDPARARELNQASKERITVLQKEGTDEYEARMAKGDIQFKDREKVARELNVPAKEAASINKTADDPDPAYDPRLATELDTRLQKYNPRKLTHEQAEAEYYGIKEHIRQLPSGHRADYKERLEDIRAQTKPPSTANDMLGDLFKHLDESDTGKPDGLFGDDGTNHETGKKLKITDPVKYAEHFAGRQTIKDGLRKFVESHPDATPGDLWDEYAKQARPFIKGPGNLEAFEKSTSKLPAPAVTAAMIEAERKRIQENRPPTALPTTPQTPRPMPAGVYPERPVSTPAGATALPATPTTVPTGLPTESGAPTPFRPTIQPTTAATPMKVTAYTPGKGDIVMEGKNEVASRRGPAYTVEQFQAGKVPHVSVAMDPKSPLQGQYLKSDEYPGIIFKVEDTGGAFKGKGNTAADIAFSDPQKAKAYAKDATFTPIGREEAMQLAAKQQTGHRAIVQVGHGIASVEKVSGKGARNQMTQGKINVGGTPYEYKSGGHGRGNLPPGKYVVTEHQYSRKTPGMTVGDVGFSFALTDAYDRRVGGTRTLLRIHPDGGTAGTAGCIGIVGGKEVQAQFRDELTAAIRKAGGKLTLTVG